ncbi:PilN domain-containing protein [Motilibacter aurantiacus]|uniref:PilN domain-containing protein n=1 Tax=Motilibacter aurantiacus TaxID=2714955 RepID=UPI001409F409|nr:PilN domain-containing protein [Motilibacter aurantiacus]NHC46011.1 hypothetical protein [Motilibacter aurantiacus]
MTTPTFLSAETADTAVSAARAAVLPRVNLLPPEILEQQRFRRVQAGLGAGLGLVAALVVAGYALSAGSVSDARQDLAAARSEGAQLQSAQQEYADVPQVEADLKAESALLAQAMGRDVRWSQYLRDIGVIVPKGVWLTEVSIVQPEAGAATATDAAGTPATGSAVTSAPVATITFTGKATSQDAVAGWLDALSGEPGFADPYFTNSQSAVDAELGRTLITFSSSVNVTAEALSHRYDSTGS